MKIYMGVAHSFVSFFGPFFLKSDRASISIKLFPALHFIEQVICNDMLLPYLCLAGKKRK